MKFEQNTDVIIKRAHQRQYFLRKLSVQKPVLQTFYSSFIESILWFSFIFWFPSLTVKNRKRLQTIVTLVPKSLECPLASFCEQQVKAKAHDFMGDSTHVLHSQFQMLSLGRCLCLPRCSTNRHRALFIPEAISLVNKELKDNSVLYLELGT